MARMNNATIIDHYCMNNGISEELHTFAQWKKMGYQVKRGEKSAHKIPIWNYHKAKKEDEDSYFYMKKASFFTKSQVERI